MISIEKGSDYCFVYTEPGGSIEGIKRIILDESGPLLLDRVGLFFGRMQER